MLIRHLGFEESRVHLEAGQIQAEIAEPPSYVPVHFSIETYDTRRSVNAIIPHEPIPPTSKLRGLVPMVNLSTAPDDEY